MSANVTDLSTRRLKRTYFRSLRRTWHYEPHRQTGATRAYGLSGTYWSAFERATQAREELKRRGVWLP